MIEIATETLHSPKDLVGLEADIRSLETSWAQYEKTFNKNKEEYTKHITRLREEREMLLNGLDVSGFNDVLSILDFHGFDNISGDITTGEMKEFWDVTENAILALAFPGKKSLLYSSYIGVKGYAHWRHQRFDCTYGMCPSYGNIVASIGLTKEARQRELDRSTVDRLFYFIYKVKKGDISKTWLHLVEK